MDEVKVSPSRKNKDLIQSYALTTMRDEIGLYGQRLILRLVEAANATGITEGLDFKHGTDLEQVCPARVESELFGEFKTIVMPATAVLGEAEEYTKLHRDIKACMRHIIEYIDSDGDWIAFPLLSFAKCNKQGIKVQVRQELWDAFLNFTKGFRKFELNAALSFKSTYSLRFYQLMSGQTEPLTYSIKELKQMFGLIQKDDNGRIIKEKYKGKPTDFIKYVIDPAKAELDSCSPYTFEYAPLESRKRAQGRAAITAIQFFPIKQPKFRDPDLEANELTSNYRGAFGDFGLSIAQKNILMHKFGLTDKGIRNNFKLWEALVKNGIDITRELDLLAVRVANLRPENPAGYVIKSFKGILRDAGIKI